MIPSTLLRLAGTIFVLGFVHTLLGQSATAASVTWNTNSTGSPVDGGGTWNTTSANWWNASTDAVWPNTTSYTAVFGASSGAAGTVLVTSVSANGLTFNTPASGTYLLSQGTINLGGATPTVTTNATSGTIGSTIAGSVGLTTAGAGTLVLAGNNLYTGTTTISAGILQLAAGGSLATAGSLNLSGSGTFNVGSNSQFISGLLIAASANSNIIGSNGVLRVGGVSAAIGLDTNGVNETSSLNVSGISLNFSSSTTPYVAFTNTGAGSGNNGATATLTVGSGTVNAANMTVAYANYPGGSWSPNANGTINLNSGGVLAVSGTLTPVFANHAAGAKTATVNIGSGGMLFVNTIAPPSNFAHLTATINLSGGTIENYPGANLTIKNLSAAASSTPGAFNLANTGTFYIAAGQTGSVAQVISDSGATPGTLNLMGAGLLSLNAANTYSGGTIVSGGTLQIGNGGSLNATGPISIGANATLAFSRSDTPTQGTDFSSSGISGAGGIAQIGAGLLTLNASNTYSGPTTVSAGTLAVNGALMQSSTISVGTAGTLAGAGSIGGNTSLTTLTGNGVINLSSGTIGGPLNVTGGNWTGFGTVNGLVTSSSNVFTVASGGTLNAAGNMLLSGGTLTGQGAISGGTLTLGSGAAVAPGATANINNIGTLNLPSLATGGGSTLSYDFSNTTTAGGGVNDLIQVAGNLSLAGTTMLALNASGGSYASGSPYTLFTYAGQLNQSGTFALAPGSIGGRQSASFDYGTGNNSAITVTINGYFANLTWVGTNSQTWVDSPSVTPWTSPTSPAGDYFTKGDSVTFADTVGGAAITISGAVSPSSLTVSNTNTSYTFGGSGSITGNTSLVMNGPGALTINTSNSYTGGTYLNGGLLNLGNSAALGSGPLTINGGTLDNTATAAMTLAGNIAQSWSGDFTFNGTQNLNLGTGPVTLGGYRTLTVNNGTLTVGGAISDGGNAYSLTLAGSGTLILGASNGYSGGTTINGGTLQVNNINALGSGTVYDYGALRYNLTSGSIAGGIYGSGAVIYSGGLLTLTGGQYNTGATVVSAGTLALGTGASLSGTALSVANGGVFTAPSVVTLNSGTALIASGTAYLNCPAQTLASLDGDSTGVIYLNGTALTVSNSGVFSGSLRDNTGRGSLVSGGNLTLGGSNTYSGGTTITSGTLALGPAGTLGSGTLTINQGGVLDVSAYGPAGYNFGGSALSAGAAFPTSGDINGTLNLHNATLNVAGGTGTVTITNGGLGLSGGTLNYVPNDLISMTGTLALANTVNIALLTPLTSGTYTLFTYGSLSGGTGNLALSGPFVVNSPRVSYSFSASGGSVDLTMTGAIGNLQWNGGSNQTWDAGVSQSWTNLSSGSADVFYSNDNVTFNDTPGTAQTVTISGTVQPGSLTFSNTAASYTLTGSGSIAGNTSMTINGPGAVTIGTSNAFTGGINLLAGLLNIANSAALGSGPLTISGGTLDNTSGAALTLAGSIAKNVNGSFVFGGSSPLNTGSGAVALGGSATVTVSGTGALTIGGAISGGALTKNGPGTLVLAADNSYSGGTGLSSGLLVLNTLSLGTGPLTITGGSLDSTAGTVAVTLNSNPQNWNGDFTFKGTQSLNSGLAAAITLGSSRTVTINANTLTVGPVGDGGNGYSLTLDGSGNLTLGGNNTFSGGIVVNGGTLALSAAGPGSGNSVLAQSSAITVNSGGMFYTSKQAEIGYNSAMSFVVNGGTLSMADTAYQYLKNVTLENGGLWALGVGNSTYQNGANFNALVVTSVASSRTNTITTRGGLIAGNGGVTFNAQRGTAPIDLLVSVPIFNYTGVGTVTENGNAIVALTASNTYTGATTINGGTLQLGNGGTAGSISASSAVTDNSALVFDRSDTGAGYTFASAVSGSGNVVQIGSGRVVLAAINGYSGGTTVNNGTLALGSAAALGTGGLAANGGTLDLEGYSLAVPSFSGAAGTVTDYGSGGGTTTLTVDQAITTAFGGQIVNGPMNLLALTLTGPGTLILSGTNSYTGGTTVDAGTLILDTSTTLADGSSLTVGQGASSLFAPAAGPAISAPAAVVAVPEPGTIILLVAALWSAAINRGFRRRRS
jgi:fibronectin-binding autotransporter adhesin